MENNLLRSVTSSAKRHHNWSSWSAISPIHSCTTILWLELIHVATWCNAFLPLKWLRTWSLVRWYFGTSRSPWWVLTIRRDVLWYKISSKRSSKRSKGHKYHQKYHQNTSIHSNTHRRASSKALPKRQISKSLQARVLSLFHQWGWNVPCHRFMAFLSRYITGTCFLNFSSKFVGIMIHLRPSRLRILSTLDHLNLFFCLCGSIQFNCRNLQKVSCFVSSMLLCRLPISPAALPSKKPCDASWRFQSHLSLWHRWPRMENVDRITTWFSLHDLNIALTYGIDMWHCTYYTR